MPILKPGATTTVAPPPTNFIDRLNYVKNHLYYLAQRAEVDLTKRSNFSRNSVYKEAVWR